MNDFNCRTAICTAVTAVSLTLATFGLSGPSWAQSAVKRTTTSVYDKWTLICNEVGKDKGTTCVARLIVMNKKKARVIALRIGYSKEKDLFFEMVTPTNVLIEPGVSLAIDENEATKIPYRSCGNKGCRTSLKLNPTILKQLVRGKQAKVGISLVNGKGIQFAVDITGAKGAMAGLVNQTTSK